jgi:hypothetical protein
MVYYTINLQIKLYIEKMRNIVVSVLMISLFFACSKSNNNNSTPPTKSNGLMPLSVGNFWEYNKTIYDSNGVVIGTTLDEIDIIEQVGVSGITYYEESWASFPKNVGSFFVNADTNTLVKYDSAIQYTFFKRVQTDSTAVDSWSDTVTSRCKGHNYLYAFTDSTNISGFNCLRNVIYVNDCAGFNFEKWVYYLQPGLGLVRIQHYVVKSDDTFYLQSSEDLGTHHIN